MPKPGSLHIDIEWPPEREWKLVLVQVRAGMKRDDGPMMWGAELWGTTATVAKFHHLAPGVNTVEVSAQERVARADVEIVAGQEARITLSLK